MNASKILTEEISAMTVSSLPTRPTAPTALGGRGYSSAEMKSAFDRLPLFIIERYNALIEDIMRVGEDSLAAAIQTSIYEGHTLSNMFSDIKNGSFASYLAVDDRSLTTYLADITVRLEALEGKRNE